MAQVIAAELEQEQEEESKTMLGAKYRCKLCGQHVIGRMIHFAEKHEDLALSNFEELQGL